MAAVGHFILLMHIMWRRFLPSTVRCCHLWLAHSLTFWIDLLQSTAQMHPHCWACRLAFFLQPVLRVVAEHITAHFPRLTSCSYLSTWHSHPVGLWGKYGNTLTFTAVRLEVWSSAALRLSGSDSRASACPAILGQCRLSWPAFSWGIPNASSSALQHSR